MGIFKAFSTGIKRVNKNKKMWFFLLVVNILIALVLTFPLYSALKTSIGDSLMGERLTKGFDYRWYDDFRYRFQDSDFITYISPTIVGSGAFFSNVESLAMGRFLQYSPTIVTLIIVYILLNIIFAGGILGVFHSPEEKFTIKRFFSFGGNYFNRFLRLFIISWVFYGILYFVLVPNVYKIVNSVSQTAFSERVPMVIGLIFAVVMFFLLFLVNMIFDYAKIRTVVGDSRSMLKETGRAIAFVFRNFGRTMGLYYFIGLLGIVFMVIYGVVEPQISQITPLLVLLAFVWQQVYMLGRIWVRLTFFSSQLNLFIGLQAEKKVTEPAASVSPSLAQS